MKAGKLIKLGRTTKLLRVLRIVRMIKLIKLALKGKEETEEELAAKAEEEAIADKGSVVGHKLAQKTTLNVLLGILLMMFVLPFLNYDAEDNSFAWGFDQLRRITDDARMDRSAKVYQEFLTGPSSPNAAFDKNPDGDVVLREIMFLKLENKSGTSVASDSYAQAGWAAKYNSLRTSERLILEAKEIDGVIATVEYSEVQHNAETTSPYEVTTAQIEAMSNVVVLSRRSVAIQEAYYSFVLIMFIMVMLLGSSAFFNADANLLVVGPIENMVKRISDMQADPLGLNADIEAEQLRIATEKKKMAEDNDPKLKAKREAEEAKQAAAEAKQAKKKKQKKKPEQYETAMLNNTIGRIQQLLRVGFGSAGGEIVAKTLLAAEAGEAPKVASKFGLRVYGIWGFCIIEDFNEILVALDDDIMTFVNCVAGMVHTEVQKNKGAVNKNIGEAFLLTWKVQPSGEELKFVTGDPPYVDADGQPLVDADTQEYYCKRIQDGGEESLPGLPKISLTPHSRNAADYALAACVAIAEAVDTEIEKDLASLDSAVDVDSAVEHPAAGHVDDAPPRKKSILELLREKIDPHFRVHMGVGLNYGWAIEGAIGSEHKVDASYLSPNVNTAARLETANHQFGTKMLISQIVVDMMSPACQKALRCVDCVRPKGVATGINIYTCDLMHLDDIFGAPKRLTSAENRKRLATLAAHVPLCAKPEFQTKYKQAFELYFAGDWTGALPLLEECKALTTVDDPENGGGHGGCNFEVATGVLIDTIQSYGNSPPKAGEKGYKDGWIPVRGKEGSGRALTAK